MKYLLNIILALAALTVSVNAQKSTAITVGSAVVSNIFSSPKIIEELSITATTTNTTTVKFYDSANTTTTRVLAAYTSYSSFSTNITTITTNESGLLLTNSVSGIFTYPVSNAASTNELPRIYTTIVPGSTTRVRDVTLQTIRGLSVYPSAGVIVEVVYRDN